jgi:ABC-type amino acid transport system permease subunit
MQMDQAVGYAQASSGVWITVLVVVTGIVFGLLVGAVYAYGGIIGSLPGERPRESTFRKASRTIS